MADYLFADDGKIHTRYSELIGCTAGAITKVVERRLGLRRRVQTPSMEWGTDAHELWEEESRSTGRIPERFRDALGSYMPVSHIEEEFAVELYAGVIIHLRPDAVAAEAETIIDYKTVQPPEGEDWSCLLQGKVPRTSEWNKLVNHYRSSRQLKFYAFMTGCHGIRIRRGVYLLEIWNRERTKILGYYAVWQEYKLSDLAKLLPWVQERVALLSAAVKMREEASV